MQDAIVQQSENFTVSGEIFIQVVGEVFDPGLYELSYGSRVRDVIDAAGGFTTLAVQIKRQLSSTEFPMASR